MEQINWWKTTFAQAEIDLITKAILNQKISQGTVTGEFEAKVCEILKVPYAVAVPSGSMALVCALMALGVEPGDEVICPDRTFIATAHAVTLLGAKVVLTEINENDPNIDPSKVEAKITKKTKGILCIHLNGRMCDMAALQKIAKKHGLFLVEDAAQAFYSKHPLGYSGTLSDIGTFSLGMAKIISTGQGGLCVTKSKALYEKMMAIRNHGVEMGKTHDSDYTMKATNFKFTDIQAAAGIAQLGRLPEKVERVQAIYRRYVKGLAGLDFVKVLPVDVDNGEIALWTEVLSPERAKVMKYLADNGIATEKFLPDLHRSAHLGNKGKFPEAASKFDLQGFVVPCGPAMPLESVDRVIEVLKNYKKAAAHKKSAAAAR